MTAENKPNFDDNIMEFAVRFEDLRRAEGKKVQTFKQISDEIYEKTGTYISHTQLSKYVKMESGEVPLIYPKINIILAIAKCYGVTIEYLMGLSDSSEYATEYKEGSSCFGLSDEAMDTLSKALTHSVLPLPAKYKKYSECEFMSFLIVNFAIKFEQAIISYLYAVDELDKYKELHMDNGKTVKDEYMNQEAIIIDDYQLLEQAVYSQKYILTQLVEQFLDDLVIELTEKETD